MIRGPVPYPGGEYKTVAYLETQFQDLGLKPGNTDGTYIQKVPLVGITPTPAPLVFSKGAQRADAQMERRRRRVDQARRRLGVASTNSELVFVGYGVVAPEFNWDDYKGVDVKGKTHRHARQRSAGARSRERRRSSIRRRSAARR